MSNELKREELKEFIVRIKYEQGDQQKHASGVILKIDRSQVYIFTAKHTFKDKDKQPLSNITYASIDKACITVNDYWDREIKIDELISLEDTTLDIVILKVAKESFDIFQNTKKLELYMGVFNLCAIAGYPQSRKGIKSSVIQMSNPDEIDFDSPSFQLKSEEPLYSFEKPEMETIKGISGGGVFKRGNSGKIFLVGIQYAYIDTIYLKCLDLRKIIKEVERKIGTIPVGEYPFFEELGINMNKLSFESLEDNFRANNDIRKVQKKSDEYAFLIEDNRRNKNLEKNYHHLKKKMKSVADVYFYHGKVFLENENTIRAYSSFSRAIELHPAYKSYFMKDEFRNEFLTRSQKQAREKLQNALKSSDDDTLYEKVLKDNIETHQKTKNYDALEKSYGELITFYYLNFKQHKLKIIGLLKLLFRVKLMNKKPMEAEKTLLKAKKYLNDGENTNDINILLTELYISETYVLSECSSYRDIYLKLLALKTTFHVTDKYYLLIDENINKLSAYKTYENDCFVEHIEAQRKEIAFLKQKNSEYLQKINIKPKFIVGSKKIYSWWFVRWLLVFLVPLFIGIFVKIDMVKKFFFN